MAAPASCVNLKASKDKMRAEIAQKASFSTIRYAQCWEDADILLEALEVQPGDVCLSIASAGDNTLALLSKNPGRVIALDLNPAQLACLELRVAAYRELSHPELLEFIGSAYSSQRSTLYQRCRPGLSKAVQQFWDVRSVAIEAGIGSAGKFEHYFALFRRYILPLIHYRQTIDRMLMGGTLAERHFFYDQIWNTWRWQLLFRLFFSRQVMGRLGRDPSFFSYVDGQVGARILERTKHAITELDPADNPYMQWILLGRHASALPYALRPENFEPIRANLDRLEWHCQSIEEFFGASNGIVIDRYNLSDIFEYMSFENYESLLQELIQVGRTGSRLVYWNMLAPRSRPEYMAGQLRQLSELACRLHLADKAFFYSNFIVEEVISNKGEPERQNA
jgi:S-adenosylmethionine-diacylglycerol 3-amino-3-carboxypropyl transferase